MCCCNPEKKAERAAAREARALEKAIRRAEKLNKRWIANHPYPAKPDEKPSVPPPSYHAAMQQTSPLDRRGSAASNGSEGSRSSGYGESRSSASGIERRGSPSNQWVGLARRRLLL